jgi:hypothetical protein
MRAEYRHNLHGGKEKKAGMDVAEKQLTEIEGIMNNEILDCPYRFFASAAIYLRTKKRSS